MVRLFPDAWEASTFNIDYNRLYELGYRGLIFDIDNTLVMDCAPATKQAVEFIKRLQAMGFETCLLSNNNEKRVASFNEDLHMKYIFKAKKPQPDGYQKAMDIMGTDRSNTIFIGDQIFTDVWGARRANVKVILVKPIHPNEIRQIRIKRIFEKPVLLCYRISKKSRQKFYD